MKVAVSRSRRLWRIVPTLLSLAATFFSVIFFTSKLIAFADDFSSVNFIDKDPVILMQGGIATSSNFQIISGTSQNDIGESASANFGYHSGYFYFPLVTSPTLSATAGDQQVALTWSAAVGSLGLNVNSYSIGQSTDINGPYSYTNVGNVLSSTRVSLTNNTTYYFVVRALDLFGLTIATSSPVSATPVASGGGNSGNNGNSGGGGGGPYNQNFGSAYLTGESIPNSQISILVNGIIVSSAIADVNGNFSSNLSNLTPGLTIISLYATDINSIKTSPVTVVVTILPNLTTNLTNIFLPPTLTTDKEALPTGDTLKIFGYAQPYSKIDLLIEGKKNVTLELTTDATGKYSVDFVTDKLTAGSYKLSARSKKHNTQSPVSHSVFVTIGEKTVIRDQENIVCPGVADFNHDCRVDLVDFSIMLFWFGNPNPPANVELTHDNIVNIIDFSILMYYWTG